jgi:hypothetical protein
MVYTRYILLRGIYPLYTSSGFQVTGVAGKPRFQRPGKFTCEAIKGKGKDDTFWPAPLYQPVHQELPFDSDSEGAPTVITPVEHQQQQIDPRH